MPKSCAGTSTPPPKSPFAPLSADRSTFSEFVHAFEVSIDPAPKLDPSIAPSFTAKQGQYLAFIYSYTKIHRQAPAESDLERYFQVSRPQFTI